MKHLGRIVLVLFESLGMVGDAFLSAVLGPVGGILVVLDQVFGLVEQKASMFVCRLDVVCVLSRCALA
jgi:hypothetical protein